jgi:cytochrome c2
VHCGIHSRAFGACAILTATLAVAGSKSGSAAEALRNRGNESAQVQGDDAAWAGFVETNFPFFSSVLDARRLGAGWPADNLTPRGLILNLGHRCWACFDTDLLRVSAIWTGQGVSPVSMAQGSYHRAGVKVPEGQGQLPQIAGTPWMANGIYPGWQASDRFSFVDPREAGPDRNEVGRGPLASTEGRFKAVRLSSSGVCLEYEVAGATVREWMEARMIGGQPVVQRRFRIGSASKPLWLLLGRRPAIGGQRVNFLLSSDPIDGHPAAELTESADGLQAVQVGRSANPVEFSVSMGFTGTLTSWKRSGAARSDGVPAVRCPEIVITQGRLSSASNAYVVDNIALPLDNPWKRNVRLADLAFFSDGRAAAVTFDGDVWVVSGLAGELREVTWRRFASGLHEPLGICIRNGELFVFDRNGIWHLHDTDGNGEADVHELFCNAFTQTAETREYANGIRAAPDGSFVIAKGGQQGTTTGKQNGTVLRVSPDGETATVIGWGLRQPFIGVHPRSGLVTASDQQGNYVPATPLHIIREGQFYGFISMLLPKEQYPAPIAEPLTWIPHAINASGAGQVWLTEAKMGPLNDGLIHLGYYRAEIFRVLLNERATRTQAAVVSLTRDLEFAPLNGALNPLDGQLYLAGFQIWGTVAKQVSGLARLRYTGAPSTLPRQLVAMDKGILLRFDVPLEVRRAADAASFSAERWNYLRTANYGSPHFKLDGSKGQESMTPSSAYLSRDKQSVFIGIPEMKPVMQMRLGWSLLARTGTSFEHNAYFTPHELLRFDPVREGFDPLTVDLTPRIARLAAATPVTAEEGERVAELMGCVACHSVDGTTLGKIGPTWKGLFGSERIFVDGSKALADEAYLRESIKEPAARVIREFEKSDTGMPSYDGVISDGQIEALILYLKTLR